MGCDHPWEWWWQESAYWELYPLADRDDFLEGLLKIVKGTRAIQEL
jgi:hypothetical protein